jgi:hypothetical protein
MQQLNQGHPAQQTTIRNAGIDKTFEKKLATPGNGVDPGNEIASCFKSFQSQSSSISSNRLATRAVHPVW